MAWAQPPNDKWWVSAYPQGQTPFSFAIKDQHRKMQMSHRIWSRPASGPRQGQLRRPLPRTQESWLLVAHVNLRICVCTVFEPCSTYTKDQLATTQDANMLNLAACVSCKAASLYGFGSILKSFQARPISTVPQRQHMHKGYCQAPTQNRIEPLLGPAQTASIPSLRERFLPLWRCTPCINFGSKDSRPPD